MIGAGEPAEVEVSRFAVSPNRLKLGDRLAIELQLVSTAKRPQKLVIDYAVHYVKKSGNASAKVFKWKELSINPGQSASLLKSQVVKDFTTRKHHPGKHVVEVLVNGAKLAAKHFTLESKEA